MKLFRTIRKKLIVSKKAKDYFKYAIGEILLVIIGILIALSINNWNSNKKTALQQQKLIGQVITDLKQSENDLLNIIAFNDLRARASAHITQAFWLKEPLNDSLLIDFMRPLSNRRYKPNMAMISSLINSGDIQLVNSLSVISEINGYYEDTNTNIEDILRYEDQYYKKGVDIVNSNFDAFSLNLIHRKKAVLDNINDFNYAPYPEDFSEVPFPIAFEDVYTNKQIYSGYLHLLTAFRNIKVRYETILNHTQSLLAFLEAEGYK